MPPTSPLDSGPPLPPGMSAPAPKPSLGGMAGDAQGGPGGPQNPPASIQSVVIPKLMEAEKQIRDASKVLPALQIAWDTFRASAGRALADYVSQGQGGSPAATPGVGSLMASGMGPMA